MEQEAESILPFFQVVGGTQASIIGNTPFIEAACVPLPQDPNSGCDQTIAPLFKKVSISIATSIFCAH